MSEHTVIVTPCYNEEKSIVIFLQRLEQSLVEANQNVSVVVVDDCSQDNTLALLTGFEFQSSLLKLQILRLKFNCGHQSAIFYGIQHAQSIGAQRVIVMDSDGEDDPRAIPDLLKINNYDIVEVKRGKRKESLSFRILYRFYKIIFRLITGKNMNYGNYCMISHRIIECVTYNSFIHFPAFLLKQKATRTSLRVNREKRISGQSKMGLQGLLIHSFKSFIEFGEDLLMIFLKLFALIIVAIGFLLIFVLYQKYVTKEAILGWTSTLIIGLGTIAMLCFGFFITGILLLNLMHQQNNKTQKKIYVVVK
jgi:polyisoprenyl-phosphate glycosyltransferase